MASNPLYFRLSSFYFFYFAALGVFSPYWTLYLKDHLHFSFLEIGQLLAIFMTTKLIAPLLWGWIADYFDNRLYLIRLATLLTVVSFSGVYLYHSYWWMALVMFVFGFFWHASLPQYEAITLNHLGSNTSRYSHIRLWGSVGFIVMVAGLPVVIDNEKIAQLPHYLLLIFIALALTTVFVSDKPYPINTLKEKNNILFFSGIFFAFLVACALQAVSHGAYYTFFSVYLEDHGYSRVNTGLLWALGVLAEVALFIVLHRLMRWVSLYHLFSLSLFLTALRWLILGFYVDNLWLLLFSQLLHAASFGLFHASAIHLIHHWFPEKSQGRGQAFYAGISFGLGGAIGGFLSGYLWENVATHITFLLMAFCALLGGCIAWLFVKEPVVINR
jgi:PPP family 3-phenylpropionic acid transporter